MMLSKEEFLRLQKLAAISLDKNQTEKFWNQISTIVDFLWKLKDIQTKSVDYNIDSNKLKTISWVDSYKDFDILFGNTKHERIANSIVISSVIDN